MFPKNDVVIKILPWKEKIQQNPVYQALLKNLSLFELLPACPSSQQLAWQATGSLSSNK